MVHLNDDNYMLNCDELHLHLCMLLSMWPATCWSVASVTWSCVRAPSLSDRRLPIWKISRWNSAPSLAIRSTPSPDPTVSSNSVCPVLFLHYVRFSHFST